MNQSMKTYLFQGLQQVIRVNLELFNLGQLFFFWLFQHHVQSRVGGGRRGGRGKRRGRAGQDGPSRKAKLKLHVQRQQEQALETR